MDVDYRKSLYNHSILHYSKNNMAKTWSDETLTKRHFSFRNIHQNLGYIRWWSKVKEVIRKNIITLYFTKLLLL